MARAKGFRAVQGEAKGGQVSATGLPNPIRERDRLKEEIQALYDRYLAQTRLRQKAESMRGPAERNLVAAEEAVAKGKGSQSQLNECELALKAWTEKYDTALARANRALETRKSLEYELEQLYSAYFAEFAAEAEKASKMADAALHEMVSAYRRAQEAWATAQAAWTPLCHSVKIAPMLPFPVDDFTLAPIITGWHARPPGVTFTSQEYIDEQALFEVAG